jgi:hypothetical protein
MPRYYYDIWRDDEEAADEEGVELPNLDAVRTELCEAVAELARENLRRPVERRRLSVRVRDANGRHLYQARLQFDLEPLGQDATLSSSTRSARDTEH